MITKVKGCFIIAALTLCSCTDSGNTEINDNAVDHRIDSPIETSSEKTFIRTENPLHDSLLFKADTDCELHLAKVLNQAAPAGIEIIHCSYRSTADPVWLEHSYSFEIARNDSFFNELVDYNQMIPLASDKIEIAENIEWFLPKTAGHYEGYYTEDDFDDFQVFKDRESGHLFIRGSQY